MATAENGDDGSLEAILQSLDEYRTTLETLAETVTAAQAQIRDGNALLAALSQRIEQLASSGSSFARPSPPARSSAPPPLPAPSAAPPPARGSAPPPLPTSQPGATRPSSIPEPPRTAPPLPAALVRPAPAAPEPAVVAPVRPDTVVDRPPSRPSMRAAPAVPARAPQPTPRPPTRRPTSPPPPIEGGEPGEAGPIPPALQRVADGLLSGAIESAAACRVAERDLEAMASTMDGEAAALSGYLLARIRARLDDQPGAHTALKHAWERSERHPLVALGMGEHFLRTGSPREALGYLDRALRADVRGMRTHSEILVLAAEAAERCSKPDLAEAMMIEASQDPDPAPMVLRALARRSLAAGDKAAAVESLSRILEQSRHAEQVPVVTELVDLLISLDRVEEAIVRLDAVLRQVIGADPMIDNLERKLVALQLEHGQSAGAAMAAERRVSRGYTPTRAEAHRAAAHAYGALAEHGKVVTHLREARKVEPASAELAVEYVRARDAAGQHQGLEHEINELFLMPTLGPAGRAELLRHLGTARATLLGDAAGAQNAWREAAAMGDIEAAALYAERLSHDPERQVEAIGALKSLLALDPSRIDAIQLLAELYNTIGATSEAGVCAGLLHLVDARYPSADPPPADAVRTPPADMLENLCPKELRPAALAASLIWEHGTVLLRTDLNSFGVSPAQRLSPLEDVPVAAVYASATRLLGVPKTAMFIRPFGDSIQVAATVPPSVICGQDLTVGMPETRFKVARAVASTRAEYLLWSALPIDRSKAAYEAIRFAFAPAEEAQTAVDNASALGQEYGRTLPPKVQRQLRELLALAPLPAFKSARHMAQVAMHRAAVVATGDPAAALVVVADETPELEGVDVRTPEGFSRAVRSSELARDIVSFALSDQYLTLRFRLDEATH